MQCQIYESTHFIGTSSLMTFIRCIVESFVAVLFLRTRPLEFVRINNFSISKLTFSAHSIMVHSQRRVISISVHRYICKIKKKIMKTMKIINIARVRKQYGSP